MNEYFKYKPLYKWFCGKNTENIEDFFLWIKHCFQRATRGYADCDVWNFDYYLSIVIYEGLKQLKNKTNGYPTEVKSFEEWKNILQTMIDGFEAARENVDGTFFNSCVIGYKDETAHITDGSTFIMKDMPKIDTEKYKNEIKIRQDKLNKALDLFKQYYFGLWD